MARKTTTETKVDRLEAVVDADALVEVRYHDESTFTFDLYFGGKRIAFVEGVAHVDSTTANELHEAGHVK